jgi:hypothetical protein
MRFKGTDTGAHGRRKPTSHPPLRRRQNLHLKKNRPTAPAARIARQPVSKRRQGILIGRAVRVRAARIKKRRPNPSSNDTKQMRARRHTLPPAGRSPKPVTAPVSDRAVSQNSISG